MVNANKLYKYLRIVFMTIFILSALKSCSYALTNAEWKADCREKLQTLTDKGLLNIQNVDNVNLTMFDSYTTTGYIILVGHSNNGSLAIGTTTSLMIAALISNGNIINQSSSSNYWAQGNTSNWVSNAAVYTLSGSRGSTGALPFNAIVEPFYCYNASPFAINTRILQLGAGEEYGGSYIINRFTIEMLTNNIINTYQGYNNVYSYYYTFNNNNWLIGEIGGYEDTSEVVIKLIHADSDRVIKTWYKSDIVNDRFSVNGSLIYRNDVYFLDYEVWVDGTVTDIGRFVLVFMPPGTVINNGTIVSVGSGEGYTIQNSTNDILDSSTVDNQFNTFLSGDISATLGYNDYDNPYQDIIFGLAYNICDVLLSEGDVYFDYSMHGETPTRIYASSFTTPENNLKIFIRLSMVFGVLYVIYSQFKEIIEAISTARAPNVLHDVDADVYFYKM